MVLNSFYTFLDYIIRNFINAYRIFSFNFILKPQPSLDDSARFDHSWESDNLVFTSSDFTTKCFLYKAWSWALCPSPSLENQVSLYFLRPPVTGWSSHTPRHRVSFVHLLQIAGLLWRYSSLPPHRKYLSSDLEKMKSFAANSYNYSHQVMILCLL